MELVRIKQNNEALYQAANLLIEDPKWFDAIKAIARDERSRNTVLSAMKKIIALK